MAFIAPLLVGTAGTAATATTAATAATSGLFGVGGSLALGQTALTAGTALSALGSIRAGQAQAAAADYNARLANIESSQKAMAARRAGQQYIGAARAGRAKSGVTAEGTPLLAIAESAANAEIDALNSQWAGRMEAGLYKAQARSARQAGMIGAGTSLLSGTARLQGF